MSRQSMKLALEALELLARYENPSTKIQIRKPKDGGSIVTMYPHKVATEAAALLRERLAQPDQEPVAWASSLDFDDDDQEIIPAKDKGKLGTSNCDIPLYTVPKQWVGLTDEEIHDLSYLFQKIDASNSPWFDRWGFARAIEAEIRRKNT